MIDSRSFYDQLIENDISAYDNIWKTDAGRRYYYATISLLDFYISGQTLSWLQ